MGGIAEIRKGSAITQSQAIDGIYKVVAGGMTYAYTHNKFNRDANTITIGASGAHAGFVAIWNEPIFASDCITVRATEQSLTQYIFYSLKYRQNEIYDLSRGAAQPHVYPKDIATIKIPLPPLEIERQIAIEMEHFERQEADIRTKMARLEQKKMDYLHRHLQSNWPMERLGDVANILGGGTPDTKNPDYWGGDIPWATLADTKKKYLRNTARKITQEGLRGSSAILLPINTVIFSSRATIGDVCINKVATCTNQGYKNFICKPNRLNFEYLYNILKCQSKNIAALASGATYPEVSKNKIASYEIPLPPLEIQQKVATKMERFDALIAAQQSKLAQLSQDKEAAFKAAVY